MTFATAYNLCNTNANLIAVLQMNVLH